MLVVANPAEAAAILGAMRVIADAHGAGTLSDPDRHTLVAGTLDDALDPEKLFVTWDRGTAVQGDLFAPTWNFWQAAPTPSPRDLPNEAGRGRQPSEGPGGCVSTERVRLRSSAGGVRANGHDARPDPERDPDPARDPILSGARGG